MVRTRKVCRSCGKDYVEPYSDYEKVSGRKAIRSGICPQCKNKSFSKIVNVRAGRRYVNGKWIPVKAHRRGIR